MADRMRDVLWAGIAEIYRRICEHPFITGLTDGSLAHDRFRYYIAQDAHYLRAYARALAGCAAKAPVEAELTMFVEHAGVALGAERDLHTGLLTELGTDAQRAAALPIAPTTQAYASYLLAVTGSGSYAEAVAAVLPCYWVYARVGEHLQRHGSPEPLFQRWIDTYAGQDFQAVVDEVLAVADGIGAQASPATQELMRRHFHTSARYEWMFFDAAHRMEDWPV
ncbi:thiaminase II [Mycolicibacter senuensis]|uniref:Aminopyrimidine aminohydrolase n=1 Tax=Mycolicibacter senuensis TaxID=386913 RepID=A0A7I9XHP5_9MYCO|nr:thiaminase II [Mycolicibacter senuensis]ORW65317.1 thiaminase II [Mycolicibacter senuensis]GFG68857.1 aminopyrimidine aminohydrolase [Mycolicibacter senuensis]